MNKHNSPIGILHELFEVNEKCKSCNNRVNHYNRYDDNRTKSNKPQQMNCRFTRTFDFMYDSSIQ